MRKGDERGKVRFAAPLRKSASRCACELPKRVLSPPLPIFRESYSVAPEQSTDWQRRGSPELFLPPL